MMDWKTILVTIAFLTLIILQAKTNEDSSGTSQVKSTPANSTILHRDQASFPTK